MSNLAYKCLMETNKLTGSNFTNWLCCLRLVLRHDKVEYVLDNPIGVIPNKESPEFATFNVEAHQKHVDNASDAQCVMMSSMRYVILRDLFKCKLHAGGKVYEHMLKMIDLIERLASIGTVLPANISTNLSLQSLPSSFKNFIVNFNMNNTKVGLPELHNMLKTYESSAAKVKSVLMRHWKRDYPKFKALGAESGSSGSK
ncbi:uncharacterized protein LOC121776733 [Salvia splendens]|uniref:uncharacterized protein LOC121776733 n=1 Tax=Salvia splendens TaxID=180675 RepID=UPI001C25FBA0|nr:uncharacterized protein LOC121776733 [Salvia splendens]